MSEEAEQVAMREREGVENVPDLLAQPDALNRGLGVPASCNPNLLGPSGPPVSTR